MKFQIIPTGLKEKNPNQWCSRCWPFVISVSSHSGNIKQPISSGIWAGLALMYQCQQCLLNPLKGNISVYELTRVQSECQSRFYQIFFCRPFITTHFLPEMNRLGFTGTSTWDHPNLKHLTANFSNSWLCI